MLKKNTKKIMQDNNIDKAKKKIFFIIAAFFIVLFSITICCAILYLKYDHRYHAFERAKILMMFLAKQSEDTYSEEDKSELNITFNRIVNNNKEVCGIYIVKNNRIIYKHLIQSLADDFFDKISGILLANSKRKAKTLEFQGPEGEKLFDISTEITKSNATFHMLVSQDQINNEIFKEYDVFFIISLVELLLGLLIAKIVSTSLTAEMNIVNNSLQESEQQWRLLFDSSPMGIVIIDTNGIVSQCNYSISKIFEFSISQVIGKHITQTIESKSNHEYFQDLSKLPFIESEIKIISEYGVIRNILRSPIPIISDNQFFNGIMIYYFDITEQKKNERELSLYSSHLEELAEVKTIELKSTNKLLSQEINERKIIEENLLQINSDKNKLFSIIAHDLRSPFNSLLGATDFLKNEIDSLNSDEIKELINNINNSANNVFNLLENLLTWARLQIGQITFEPENCNLVDIIDDVCNLYYISAKQKGVQLSTNAKNQVNAFADKNMLETIIRNLISNALKFTSKGGNITVVVSSTETIAKVSIIDSGIGISDKKLKNMFNIGHNSSTNGTNGEKGTGLGLILVKDFVEKNNGKLSVNSELGVGTTFTFTLKSNP